MPHAPRRPAVPGPRLTALALALMLAAGCRIERVSEAPGPGNPAEDLGVRVQAMLDGAAAAWNRGDLQAFMGDYLRSPTTTYLGSPGRVAGFEAIRDRFAPYFGPGAQRDSLRFEELRARELGERHALVTARYILYRDGQVTSSGPFSLVLVRVEGRWKIIHDHTGTDPREQGNP